MLLQHIIANVRGPKFKLSTSIFITEKDRGASIETHNEGIGSSKPLKQKSTKADRRALQEAQRAAKAAAKEAGNQSYPLYNLLEFTVLATFVHFVCCSLCA